MRRLIVFIGILTLLCSPFAARGEAETTLYGVTLRIACEGETYFPGETAVFAVTVKNGSGAQLTGMRLSEISMGDGTWSGAADKLDADAVLTAQYAVRIADILHDCALFQLTWDGGALNLQLPLTVVEPAKLTVTAEAGDWSWTSDEAHTVDFTVTNTDTRTLENVTLTLPGVYSGGERTGDAAFLRKDRRKLKTAQQTDTFLIEALAPGESVVMMAQWIPAGDLSQTEDAALAMQAELALDGRVQTVSAVYAAQREIVRPSMWTAMLAGGVSMGHVLCTLAGLTALIALLAVCRTRKFR